MKKGKLATQYNPVIKEFDASNEKMNKKSCRAQRELLREYIIPNVEPSGRVLDFGCGTGNDLKFLRKLGYFCSGIDTSREMCAVAKSRIPSADIRKEDFSRQTSFASHIFDVVISKWAMQTVRNIHLVHQEACRLLKRKGYYCFLVVHPLRQFLEKKKAGKDYFKQEIVASEIFDRKITVYEPTHTMQGYLSPYFLEHFELLELVEGYEFPAAEQIGGDIYPTYLIVVARKK